MRKLAAASAALALTVSLAAPAVAAPPDPLQKVRDTLGDIIICVTEPCP